MPTEIEINLGNYVIPLVVGVKNGPNNYHISRFAGTGFFVNGSNRICTCRHIVEGVGENELLVAKNLFTGEKGVVDGIQSHPKYDFATGVFTSATTPMSFPMSSRTVHIGDDIQVFGHTGEGIKDGNVHLRLRLYKGHIGMYDPSKSPAMQNAKSSLEISFPSHKGLSGAPLLYLTGNGLEVMGMLYANMESTIELHSYSEVINSNENLTERIYRVSEYGLAHSSNDIRSFLSDLQIS